jgi:hypothetical protein
MPSYAGTYEVRFFYGSFNALATSAPITVSAPANPPTVLAASVGTTLPSASVTAHLSGAPGGGTDWLALSLVGSPSTSYLQWTYVGGGVTSRDWTITMPSTAGSYEFRLYLNNGYTIAATSAPVALTASAPASGSGPAVSYSYDLNGNRVTAQGSTYTTSTTSNWPVI